MTEWTLGYVNRRVWLKIADTFKMVFESNYWIELLIKLCKIYYLQLYLSK